MGLSLVSCHKDEIWDLRAELGLFWDHFRALVLWDLITSTVLVIWIFSFPRPNFPKPRLFPETKFFRNQNRDFFSETKFSKTETETFSETKFFRNRNQYYFFKTKFSFPLTLLTSPLTPLTSPLTSWALRSPP